MPALKKRTSPKKRAKKAPVRRSAAARVVSVIGGIVIFVIVGGVLYTLIWGSDTETILPLNAIGSAATPVQEFVTDATRKVKDFFTDWHNYDTVQAENERLARENTQLTLQLNDAQEALAENERLQSLLNAQETYDSLDPVYAKVIARDAGQWFSTFSINKGTSQGLTTGMAVVNQDGLIGYIYEIGSSYAKVITIIDSRSGLACLIQRTRDAGIMQGAVSGITDEATCTIQYLPNINNIIPGDTVITSGTDSLYPKGLIVGTISEINLSAGSEGGYAVVEPAVDFLHIEEVLVLRTQVEKAEDSSTLPTLPTATPAPTAEPTATPDPEALATVDPETGETIWTYPGDSSGSDSAIEMLPEDDWVDDV